MVEVVSFGAGVNSSALVIWLVNRGWRGPIVFADTGCEMPETYCFLRYFESEWLKPRGLSVTTLQGMPWQRYGGGEGLLGYCERLSIVPLLSVRWCTVNWKIEPLNRYMESLGGGTQLIGIAADEAHRAKGRNCPLVDEGIDRQGCIDIIQAEGLSVPRKSGCYICPAQRPAQWRELWQEHPDLFERAAKLEESARRNERSKRTNITLDPSGRYTLRQLEASFRAQSTLPGLDMDDLRAYQPCVCGL